MHGAKIAKTDAQSNETWPLFSKIYGGDGVIKRVFYGEQVF